MNQPGPGGAGPGGPAPSEEELRAQLEAELRRLRVDDILLQTVVSLINLGARRAGLAGGDDDEVDLDQVQSAIEGVQALLPVVEKGVAASDLRPLRDALAQLQMAYAQGRGAGAAQPSPGQPPPGEGEAKPPGDQGEQPSAPGPAQASGRLWVPGQ